MISVPDLSDTGEVVERPTPISEAFKDLDAYRPGAVLNRVAAARYPHGPASRTRPLTEAELLILSKMLFLPPARIQKVLLDIQSAQNSRHKCAEPDLTMSEEEMHKSCSAEILRHWITQRRVLTSSETKEMRKIQLIQVVRSVLQSTPTQEPPVCQ